MPFNGAFTMTSGFSVGDKVRLMSTGGCGVVVHVWDEAGLQDCYVALFGPSFPRAEKPEKPPYILRYSATSLERT
jgi:hypothetical protein